MTELVPRTFERDMYGPATARFETPGCLVPTVDWLCPLQDEPPKSQESQCTGWMQRGKVLLQSMGWKPGEGLGKKRAGATVFRMPGREDFEEGSERTMMTFLLSAGKGPRLEAPVSFPVSFQAGEVLEPCKRNRLANDGEVLEPCKRHRQANYDDTDSGDGDAALPSQPPQLPPSPMPIDINEIDAFAFALLYIQWLAYGTSNNHILPWPSRVCQLQDHCRRYVHDLPELSAAIDDILQYTPTEWRNFEGYYIPELRRIIAKVWTAALKRHAFISEDLLVQLKWYYALNFYADETSLLCKFQIQGLSSQTPRLVFQAQGRLRSTKYKDVSANQRKLEIEVRRLAE